MASLHETRVVRGGQNPWPHVPRFDYFCSCGQFGINYSTREIAQEFAESHVRATVLRGACQHDVC